jgi:peptide-methionine (S)-S-oxide reductase
MNQDNQVPAPGRRTEVATLGGGCFWCLEAVYSELDGVEHVESGYSGGTVANASYHEVSTGRTGHAEVVQIRFDPEVVSYREILDVFFEIHDPTTLNRQGADVGTQYRSAIFFHSPEQKATAEATIQRLTADQVWDAPIVTEVTAFSAFYKAEAYHQQYYRQNKGQPYCRAVIAPKLNKFRKLYLEKLKV